MMMLYITLVVRQSLLCCIHTKCYHIIVLIFSINAIPLPTSLLLIIITKRNLSYAYGWHPLPDDHNQLNECHTTIAQCASLHK